MTPQQYVQDKAAASGSSFYYAFLFLPKPRRAAITAFYAFCREIDDVVDDIAGGGEDLVGGDPFVLGQGGFHDIVLVGHVAGGLDVVGLAEGDDEVGFSDGPFGVEFLWQRGLAEVAEGAVG